MNIYQEVRKVVGYSTLYLVALVCPLPGTLALTAGVTAYFHKRKKRNEESGRKPRRNNLEKDVKDPTSL